MLLLMLARWYYVWWPLHPLGYPIGPTGIMDHLWFDMFLAWLIKVSVLRYGGVALYPQDAPLFHGHDRRAHRAGGGFSVRRSLYRHGRQRDFLGLRTRSENGLYFATNSEGIVLCAFKSLSASKALIGVVWLAVAAAGEVRQWELGGCRPLLEGRRAKFHGHQLRCSRGHSIGGF